MLRNLLKRVNFRIRRHDYLTQLHKTPHDQTQNSPRLIKAQQITENWRFEAIMQRNGGTLGKRNRKSIVQIKLTRERKSWLKSGRIGSLSIAEAQYIKNIEIVDIYIAVRNLTIGPKCYRKLHLGPSSSHPGP